MRTPILAGLLLMAGPAAMAATCPNCGGDHGSYTPPASTVTASAGAARGRADRLMAEYHRKVAAARARRAAPRAGNAARARPATRSDVRRATASLARARQAQVVKEYAARALKRSEEQKKQKEQPPARSGAPATKGGDKATATAAYNGMEAAREEKREEKSGFSKLSLPGLGPAYEQGKQANESGIEATESSIDEKQKERTNRVFDSAFRLPVYAGDAPRRPAGVSLMDLYRKKEKEMREDYVKRANKVITEDKERQRETKKTD